MRGKLKRAGRGDDFLLKLVGSAECLTKDADPQKVQMR